MNNFPAQSLEEFMPFDDHEDLLPPEALLDPHHPNNDPYIQNVKSLERLITAQAKLLTPRQLQIVRMFNAGQKPKDIATQLKCHPQTVYNNTNSPKGKKHISLMRRHLTAVEGPNTAQRRAMMWRIAQDNEHEEPKTAIQAINTLNTMEDNQYTRDNPEQEAKPITITINLPQTDLDHV